MSDSTIMQSELSPEQQKRVFAYTVLDDDYHEAARLLRECTLALQLPKPSQADLQIAARILGALRSDELPRTVEGDRAVHPTWLLTETWILQNKNPLPIHEAALKLLLSAP
jgi:hypothetical protein